MSSGGKGSARRPGNISEDAWNAIFSPKVPCETCYGTGVLPFIEIGAVDEYQCLECKGKGEVPCDS